MKAYKIPNKNSDLRRYALLKNAKRLIFCLLYYAFFALAYLFYLEDARHKPLSPPYLVIFSLAVIISGFLIFKMNSFFFDRSFTGKIRAISFARNYDRGINRRAKHSFDFHTYLRIVITDKRGRRRKIRVPLFDDGFDGYYKDGDTVAAFRGLNYPLSLEAESRGERICVICGVRSYEKKGQAQDRCPSCNYSLIDIADLKEG